MPRQTYDPNDPYGISSILEQLSIDPGIYSSYYSYDDSYLSSLMADLSSIYPSYTYDLPEFTNTALPEITDSILDPTASAASANGNNDAKSGGLSSGAKIGIGVGVPLAVGVLVGIGVFLWCAGKRKGKKNGTTVVVPPAHPQIQVPQPQAYAPNPQGYIQGFQPQMPPPQYAPQQQQQPHQGQMAYGGYAKGPKPGVMELEQEYHFARPGVVEMDGTVPATQKERR
jgi:hypothetical protein